MAENYTAIFTAQDLASKNISKIATALKTMAKNLGTSEKAIGKFNTYLKGSEGAVEQLGDAFETMASTVAGLKGSFDSVQRELKEIAKSVNEVFAPMKEFKNFASQLTTALNKFVQTLSKLVTQFTAWNKIAQKAVNEGKPLVQVFKEISGETLYLGNNIKEVKQKFKQTGEEVDEGEKKFAGYNSALGGLYFNFVKISTAAIGFIGAVRAISNFLAAAVDFQFQIAQAGAVAGATADELKRLAAVAVELGAVSLKTATDVAKAEYNLASLGFTVDQIVISLKAVIVFSEGAAISVEESAAAIGAAIKSFTFAFSEAERVADTFQGAIRRSALVGSDFTRVMAGVGPVAALANQNLEDTVAALGVLRSRGLTARFAAAQVRQALFRLISPSNKAQKAMLKLGVNVRGLDGEMKPLPQIVGELEVALEGVGGAARDAALVDIFGRGGFRAIAVLMQEGSESVQAFGDALRMAGGESEKTADIMRDTIYGEVQKLKAGIEALKISLVEGKQFSAFITWLIKLGKYLSIGTANWVGFRAILILIGVIMAGIPFSIMILGMGQLNNAVAKAIVKLGIFNKTLTATKLAATLTKISLVGLAAVLAISIAAMVVGYYKAENAVNDLSNQITITEKDIISYIRTQDDLFDAQVRTLESVEKLSEEYKKLEKRQKAGEAVNEELARTERDLVEATDSLRRSYGELNGVLKDITTTTVNFAEAQSLLGIVMNEAQKATEENIKYQLSLLKVSLKNEEEKINEELVKRGGYLDNIYGIMRAIGGITKKTNKDNKETNIGLVESYRIFKLAEKLRKEGMKHIDVKPEYMFGIDPEVLKARGILADYYGKVLKQSIDDPKVAKEVFISLTNLINDTNRKVTEKGELEIPVDLKNLSHLEANLLVFAASISGTLKTTGKDMKAAMSDKEAKLFVRALEFLQSRLEETYSSKNADRMATINIELGKIADNSARVDKGIKGVDFSKLLEKVPDWSAAFEESDLVRHVETVFMSVGKILNLKFKGFEGLVKEFVGTFVKDMSAGAKFMTTDFSGGIGETISKLSSSFVSFNKSLGNTQKEFDKLWETSGKTFGELKTMLLEKIKILEKDVPDAFEKVKTVATSLGLEFVQLGEKVTVQAEKITVVKDKMAAYTEDLKKYERVLHDVADVDAITQTSELLDKIDNYYKKILLDNMEAATKEQRKQYELYIGQENELRMGAERELIRVKRLKLAAIISEQIIEKLKKQIAEAKRLEGEQSEIVDSLKKMVSLYESLNEEAKKLAKANVEEAFKITTDIVNRFDNVINGVDTTRKSIAELGETMAAGFQVIGFAEQLEYSMKDTEDILKMAVDQVLDYANEIDRITGNVTDLTKEFAKLGTFSEKSFHAWLEQFEGVEKIIPGIGIRIEDLKKKFKKGALVPEDLIDFVEALGPLKEFAKAEFISRTAKLQFHNDLDDMKKKFEDTWDDIIDDAQDKYDDLGDDIQKINEKIASESIKYAEAFYKAGQKWAEKLYTGFNDAFTDYIFGNKDAFEEWGKKLARSIFSQKTEADTKKLITGFFENVLGQTPEDFGFDLEIGATGDANRVLKKIEEIKEKFPELFAEMNRGLDDSLDSFVNGISIMQGQVESYQKTQVQILEYISNLTEQRSEQIKELQQMQDKLIDKGIVFVDKLIEAYHLANQNADQVSGLIDKQEGLMKGMLEDITQGRAMGGAPPSGQKSSWIDAATSSATSGLKGAIGMTALEKSSVTVMKSTDDSTSVIADNTGDASEKLDVLNMEQQKRQVEDRLLALQEINILEEINLKTQESMAAVKEEAKESAKVQIDTNDQLRGLAVSLSSLAAAGVVAGMGGGAPLGGSLLGPLLATKWFSGLGAFAGPVGMIAGGLIGGLIGGFGEKDLGEIEAKEVIIYGGTINIPGMKELFPLPTSAYFSARNEGGALVAPISVEQINVTGTGDPEATAELVVKKISKLQTDDYSKRFARGMRIGQTRVGR